MINQARPPTEIQPSDPVEASWKSFAAAAPAANTGGSDAMHSTTHFLRYHLAPSTPGIAVAKLPSPP